MELGERLAAWRKIRGLSQGDVAKALGITRAAVSQWEDTEESKRTSPTQAHLNAFVALIGVSLAEFHGAVPGHSKTAARAS